MGTDMLACSGSFTVNIHKAAPVNENTLFYLPLLLISLEATQHIRKTFYPFVKHKHYTNRLIQVRHERRYDLTSELS